MISLILSKLPKVVQIVRILVIPASFDLAITHPNYLLAVHDLNGNVNQSFFLYFFKKYLYLIYIHILFEIIVIF